MSQSNRELTPEELAEFEEFLKFFNEKTKECGDDDIKDGGIDEDLKKKVFLQLKSHNDKYDINRMEDLDRRLSSRNIDCPEELKGVENDSMYRDTRNCFVLEGLPTTKKKKAAKLEQTVLKRVKELLKLDDSVEVTFHMPFHEVVKKKGGKTIKSIVSLGFAFLEVPTERDDEDIIRNLDGKPLIKSMSKYTFKVNKYDDIEEFTKDVREEDFKFKKEKFTSISNLHSWMCDKSGRDQYVARTNKNVEVFWMDGLQKKVQCIRTFADKHFTKDEVRWSKLGSYLVVYNDKSKLFELYGGDKLGLLRKIKPAEIPIEGPQALPYKPNYGSQSFDFSCREKFFTIKHSSEKKMYFHVFSVRTGNLRKLFIIDKTTIHFNFKWSFDDRYLAQLAKDKILIYDTRTFEVVKTIREKSMGNFEWSPTANILGYYTAPVVKKKNIKKAQKVQAQQYPEQVQKPPSTAGKALFFLTSVPAIDNILKSKVFHETDGLTLHWHPDGDYIGVLSEVKTHRISSSEEILVEFSTTIDIFRVSEKNIPVDSMVVAQKVDKLYWEPNKGMHYAIICVENRKDEDVSAHPGRTLFLYHLEPVSYLLVKEIKLPVKDTAYISWCPLGRFFVLAEMSFETSKFSFYDTNPIEVIGTGDHYLTCHTSWDPSGRYFMASTTKQRTQESNGFFVFDISGRCVFQKKYSQLWEVVWRNKPFRYFTPKLMQNLKKQYSKIVKKHAKVEKQKLQQLKREKERQKIKKWDNFDNLRTRIEKNLKKKEEVDYEFVDEIHEREEVLEERTEEMKY